jgi:hypothetical protein
MIIKNIVNIDNFELSQKNCHTIFSQAKTISIFFVDDMLNASGNKEDIGIKIIDGEIITTALISALYFVCF